MTAAGGWTWIGRPHAVILFGFAEAHEKGRQWRTLHLFFLSLVVGRWADHKSMTIVYSLDIWDVLLATHLPALATRGVRQASQCRGEWFSRKSFAPFLQIRSILTTRTQHPPNKSEVRRHG